MNVKCPKCKKAVKWEDNPHRPFCSEKCRLIDLGKWLDEKYTVEAVEFDEDDLAEMADGQKDPTT